MKALSALLFSSLALGFAAQASEPSVPSLTCRVIEETTLGQQPPLEDAEHGQAMQLLPEDNGFNPGGYLANFRYTTQDGLFLIEAQGLKRPLASTSPDALASDYLRIDAKNLKTGEKVTGVGNPSGGTEKGLDNDAAGISASFPEFIQVECEMR